MLEFDEATVVAEQHKEYGEFDVIHEGSENIEDLTAVMTELMTKCNKRGKIRDHAITVGNPPKIDIRKANCPAYGKKCAKWK